MNSLELTAVIGTTSLAGAIWLAFWSRKTAARDRLRRRLGRIGDASAGLVRDGGADLSAVDRLLAGTGLDWSAGELAMRLCLAVVIGVIAGVAAQSVALSLSTASAGVAVLWFLVKKARERRLALCDEQMPQALEIVGLALRAGHALPGALRLAASECPAPLSEELSRVVHENSLGRPMNEVITRFAARLAGCSAVETFSVAVLVLQETGGNLITVIERIIDSARARSSYNARLRALTAEGRQSAKLLSALPAIFAGLTISVDPTYLETLQTSGGMTIALIAVGMWIAGVLWTRRLIRPLA